VEHYSVLYYASFFLGIFTAKHVSDKMAKKGKLSSVVYLIWILLFTLPTTIGTLRDYITPLPASKVGFTELHALETLSQQEEGIVVSPLYSHSQSRRLPSPKPLYAYTSTAYISAFLVNQSSCPTPLTWTLPVLTTFNELKTSNVFTLPWILAG